MKTANSEDHLHEDPSTRTRKRSAVFIDQASKRRVEVEIDDAPEEINLPAGAEGERHIADESRVTDDGHVEESHSITGVNETESSQPATIVPDIIYDDTKPKRLNIPRRSSKQASSDQSPHILKENIGFLLSPDDPEESSPKRRGRRREAFRYDDVNLSPKIIIQDDGTDGPQPTEQDDLKANLDISVARPKGSDGRHISKIHYERSPETKRKFSASPVQRMIVKSGTPSTSHGSRRKISSHARIESSTDKLQHVLPPKRKISLDARLEASRNRELKVPCPALVSTEQLRKRKVSFDTTALINGNAVIPLNDEIAAPMPKCEEETRINEDELENIELDDTTSSLDASPNFYLSSGKESLSEDSSMNYDMTDREGHTNVYHNRGYVVDDEEVRSVSPGTPPPAYNDFESETNERSGKPDETNVAQPYQPMKRIDETSSAPHRLINEERVMLQKLSTSSMSSLRSDGGTPKSILKHRKDNDSTTSENSLGRGTINVRKDSIALFSDQQDDGIQSNKKQASCWQCFSASHFKQAWQNRDHFMQKYKLHILVLFLFFMTVAFVVAGLHFHNLHKNKMAIAKRVYFDAKQRTFFLGDASELDTFTGKMGQNIPTWKLPSHCYQNYDKMSDRTCLHWKGHGQIDITYISPNNTNCYNVTWLLEKDTLLFDCFDLGSAFWYGPSNSSDNHWPMDKSKFVFNTSEVNHHNSGTFSSALEYYWLSSTGAAIILDQQLPVTIDWNNKRAGHLCFIEPEVGTGFYHARPSKIKDRRFHYTVCNSDTIMNTHKMVRERFMAPIKSFPERKMLENPHWSSVWDSDTYQLNGSVITNLAASVKERSLNCSTIEIDGKWENTFGDFVFNQQTFSNVSEILEVATSAGCEISLSVSPFISYMSSNFVEGFAREYFVRTVGNVVPALVRWEQGIGAMVDVSDDNAREWIENMLRHISEKYSIDIFRFTYGTKAWIPHGPVFQTDDVAPGDVKYLFTSLISSFGQAIVQSTANSQHTASLIELSTTIIHKENLQCIKNILPEVLNLGIMGYPFVIVGGLSTDEKFFNGVDQIPKRELYIRWMQLVAFMPAIRYTVKPWVYDEEVVAAARNLSRLRSRIVMPSIYDFRQDTLNGLPIIKPMWMVNSSDKTTFKLDDQFILGSKYLVAPILCEGNMERGVAERDIYVPEGVWRDITSDRIILGPKWIQQYQVKQFDIPIFEKLLEYPTK